jgi:Caspase domain
LFEKSNVPTAIVTSTAPVLNNDRRIALVIGNSAYENAAALPNPERDANLVADALKRTGFETVTLLTNLRKDALCDDVRHSGPCPDLPLAQPGRE